MVEHHILFPKCWAFGKVPWQHGFLPQGFAAEVSFPRMCHTPVDSTCLSNCRDGVGILEFWMGQWSKSDVRAKR